jgi:beta-glucosidase
MYFPLAKSKVSLCLFRSPPSPSTTASRCRSSASARYPFGHGLGYTRWEYLAAEVVASPAACGAAGRDVVRVRLRNTGASYGSETVQVYASRSDSAVERPVRWLAGFAKAAAAPGAEVTADIAISACCLAHWDTTSDGWVTEPGDYQLGVGRSSRDLTLSVTITSGENAAGLGCL